MSVRDYRVEWVELEKREIRWRSRTEGGTWQIWFEFVVECGVVSMKGRVHWRIVNGG